MEREGRGIKRAGKEEGGRKEGDKERREGTSLSPLSNRVGIKKKKQVQNRTRKDFYCYP